MKDLVVGAGLAGLYQADVLLNKGNDVVILEKTDKIGGQMRTVKYLKDGEEYYFDIGPHISPKYHPVWYEFNRNIDWVKIPTPITSNIKMKRNLDLIFPPCRQNIGLLNLKDVLDLFRIVPSYLKRSFFKMDENNLRESLINSWGEEFYYKYLCQLISNYFKLSPPKVSKKFKFRVSAPKFKSFLWYKKYDYYYPKHGVFEVIKHLKSKILEKKGKIELEAEIKEFNFSKNRPEVKYEQNGTLNKEIFDRIFWSGSLSDLASILNLTEQEKLDYRDLLTINVAINKPNILGFITHTTYITIPGILFHRIYEPKKLSPYMAPEDKTSACLEITLKKGDYSLKELIKKALIQFKYLYNLENSEITYLGHELVKDVYPLMYVNYKENVSNLKDKLPDNLFLIGRTGRYHPFTIGETLDSIINN
jgi:protoporphyrinogen oxidase